VCVCVCVCVGLVRGNTVSLPTNLVHSCVSCLCDLTVWVWLRVRTLLESTHTHPGEGARRRGSTTMSGVFVMLMQDEVSEASVALHSVWVHFNRRYGYPVVVFHEGALTAASRATLRQAANGLLLSRSTDNIVTQSANTTVTPASALVHAC
jgi:hypothetical protein